jgi:hypothetical protein
MASLWGLSGNSSLKTFICSLTKTLYALGARFVFSPPMKRNGSALDLPASIARRGSIGKCGGQGRKKEDVCEWEKTHAGQRWIYAHNRDTNHQTWSTRASSRSWWLSLHHRVSKPARVTRRQCGAPVEDLGMAAVGGGG